MPQSGEHIKTWWIIFLNKTDETEIEFRETQVQFTIYGHKTDWPNFNKPTYRVITLLLPTTSTCLFNQIILYYSSAIKTLNNLLRIYRHMKIKKL